MASPGVQVSTVDELEALPVAAVVADSDGQTWVRNRIGEWCEPYPASIDPDELLADGPVTVQYIPESAAGLSSHGTLDAEGATGVAGLADCRASDSGLAGLGRRGGLRGRAVGERRHEERNAGNGFVAVSPLPQEDVALGVKKPCRTHK